MDPAPEDKPDRPSRVSCFSGACSFAIIPLLIVSPFITRELTRALRHDQAGSKRFWIALAAVAACLLAMILVNRFRPRNLGTLLLGALMAWSLAQVYWVAVTRAPGVFAEDRGSGMLPLLFLTGLSSTEIFTAKLSGFLIVGAARILGILPCFLIPILLLRLPLAVFLVILALLAAWLLLCLSVNIFASVVTDDPSSARMLAEFSLAALCLATPALNSASKLFGGAPIDPLWLALSPAYGPWMLVGSPAGASFSLIIASCAWTALLGVALLAAAAAILSRSWQAEALGQSSSGPAGLGILANRMRQRQRRSARHLFEISPYAWLVARDFRPVLAAWVAIAVVLAAWTVGLLNWSRQWLVPVNAWITCLFLSEVGRFVIHYLAVRQIGLDRKSGALEILLTTGLDLEEMLAGLEAVVRRFARPLCVLVACVMAGFFVAGFFARTWTPSALAAYVFVWMAIAVFGPWTHGAYWTGFWVSLHTGRTGFAMRQRLLQYSGFTAAAVQLYLNYKKLIRFPYGSTEELLLVGAVAGIILIAMPFGFRGERKKRRELRQMIFEELRDVAAHPVPSPNDPRLKSWNPHESFYRRRRDKILV